MVEKKLKAALTIAGSDSSGGAGIQADIKTFQANGVFGMSAITAITVQNTKGVTAVQNINPEIVAGQIDVLFDDIEINAVKIGMLSSLEIIQAVYSSLKDKKLTKLVLDPVMISKSGFQLIEEDAVSAMKQKLIPISGLITPNTHEASKLTGIEIKNTDDMKKAAEKLFELGCLNVLVKGGHLNGTECNDILFNGKEFSLYSSPRYLTKNTHGTGCTLSSAIAANLAKDFSMEDSIEMAKSYISGAIENSLAIGHGCGPTHHFYKYY